MILSLASWVGSPALAQQGADLCSSLNKVIADAPNGFMSFKTKEYFQQYDEWGSSLMLDGLDYCHIGVSDKNFNCWTAQLSPADADVMSGNLKPRIGACFPNIRSQESVEKTETAIRTVIEWSLPSGRKVQLIKRVRLDGNPGSVFLYVLPS